MSSANETVIDIVKDYGEYLEDRFTSLSLEYTLEQMSYSRWTVNELLYQLNQYSSIPPLLVMENLRDKLYKFSCINKRTSSIFTIAYRTVDDAIDLVISQ